MRKKEIIRHMNELPGVSLRSSSQFGRRYESDLYLGEIRADNHSSFLEVYVSKKALRSIENIVNRKYSYQLNIESYLNDKREHHPDIISCLADGKVSFGFAIGDNIVSLEYDRDGVFHEAYVL